MTATVTEVEPDISTARIYLTVQWAAYNRVRIYRYDPGEPPKALRNVYTANGDILPPPYDYEAPLGVRVGYAAVGWNDPAPEPAAPPVAPQIITTLLTAGNAAWLTDPGRPSSNLSLDCVSLLPVQTYEANASLFRPLGRRRAVSVSNVRNDWVGDLSWITASKAEADRTEYLFAPGGVVLLRLGPDYGGINDYVQPMSVSSAPLVLQSKPHRRWTAALVTAEAPVGDRPLETGGTYQMLKDDYLTYAESMAAFPTYYDLLRYVPS